MNATAHYFQYLIIILIFDPVDNRVLVEKVEAKFENAILEQRQMLEKIIERIAELDLNKRNNLFFNGIPWEYNETSEKLFRKIKTLIKSISTEPSRPFLSSFNFQMN